MVSERSLASYTNVADINLQDGRTAFTLMTVRRRRRSTWRPLKVAEVTINR